MAYLIAEGLGCACDGLGCACKHGVGAADDFGGDDGMSWSMASTSSALPAVSVPPWMWIGAGAALIWMASGKVSRYRTYRQYKTRLDEAERPAPRRRRRKKT